MFRAIAAYLGSSGVMIPTRLRLHVYKKTAASKAIAKIDERESTSQV